MNNKKLSNLLKILQEYGVTYYKCDSVEGDTLELHLGEQEKEASVQQATPHYTEEDMKRYKENEELILGNYTEEDIEFLHSND